VQRLELSGESIAAVVGKGAGQTLALTRPVGLGPGADPRQFLPLLEREMKQSLCDQFRAVLARRAGAGGCDAVGEPTSAPSQAVLLAERVAFCELFEAQGRDAALRDATRALERLSARLEASRGGGEAGALERLVTQVLYHREVCAAASGGEEEWALRLRHYWEAGVVRVRMGDAEFEYGWEWAEDAALVQTRLTDKCWTVLTQALRHGWGASPFGPAGTGKTESVKALGHALGRLVVVFNCDDGFDPRAVSRLLVGLCRLGAWGCFDEFNRLDEATLSAVSQDLLAIQRALKKRSDAVVLGHAQTAAGLHKDVGVFITMNPEYKGRAKLPDNLRQLFRSVRRGGRGGGRWRGLTEVAGADGGAVGRWPWCSPICCASPRSACTARASRPRPTCWRRA
jgi:dynein heavy chain 1